MPFTATDLPDKTSIIVMDPVVVTEGFLCSYDTSAYPGLDLKPDRYASFKGTVDSWSPKFLEILKAQVEAWQRRQDQAIEAWSDYCIRLTVAKMYYLYPIGFADLFPDEEFMVTLPVDIAARLDDDLEIEG